MATNCPYCKYILNEDSKDYLKSYPSSDLGPTLEETFIYLVSMIFSGLASRLNFTHNESNSEKNTEGIDLCKQNLNDNCAVENIYLKGSLISKTLEKNLFTECSSGNDQHRFEHMNSRAEEPIDITNLSETLQSLIIIGQSLYTVPDIQYLMCLEDLWLVDCNIHNADKIKNCKTLRRLYLYSNALQKMPDSLSCLQQLKVLWLAGNNIEDITDYEFPPNLEALNLADNKITTIKGAFRNCNCLEILNLSGNPLQTIFEVCHLRVIKNLKILSLYDPMYDVSGITQLCNYRSFVVNILPHLEQLDSFIVEEKQTELTKIFYLNKHVYYAMMKMEVYYEYWGCKEQQYSAQIEELSNIKRKIQALNSTNIKVKNENGNSDLYVKDGIELIFQKELVHWESRFKTEHKEMEDLLNVKISNLDMELQYFGNIKFQTFSKNTDVAAECQDILNSFVCPSLKKQWNVKGVNVSFVTLVINTSLCVHEGAQFMLDIFEEQQAGELFIFCEPDNIQSSYEAFYTLFRNSVLTLGPGKQKKNITQCFIKADKIFQTEQSTYEDENKFLTSRRIAPLGFFQTHDIKSTDQIAELSHECEIRTIYDSEKFTPILLIEYSYYFEEEELETNLIELEQVFTIVEQTKSNLSVFESSVLGVNLWYKLTKLIVSYQNLSSFGLSDPLLNIMELDVSHNNFLVISEICNLFPNLEVLNASFNEISSTPSYIFNMSNLRDVDLSWNSLTNLFPTLHWFQKSAPNVEKINLKYNVFIDLHEESHAIFFVSRILKCLTMFNQIDLNIHKSPNNNCNYSLDVMDAKCKIFELSEEQLEPKNFFSNTSWDEECCSTIKTSHIAVDSEGKIKCISLMGETQFQNITFRNAVDNVASIKIIRSKLMEVEFIRQMPSLIDVNLSFNLLSSIKDSFSNLKNIVKLNLSGNYISSLEDLKTTNLLFLKVLDVSKNRLRNISGIENAINIEELYVCFNKIDILENYLFIKQFKQLKIIDVRENDLHNVDILRNYLLFHLPFLQYINGTTISEDELLEASHALGGVLDIEFLQCQYKYKDLMSTQHISVLNSSIKRVSLSGNQFHNLTSMNLENNGLVSIADLLPLGNLKYLSLTGNQICKFGDAPENMVFKKLEEVHLNSNRIYNLEPLQLHRMPQLKTLFLQDNELTTIRGIERLINLQHLILDNNRINRIQANYVRKLSNLRDLFIESNCIDTLEFLPLLKRIVKLYLSNNRIQDIKALGYLKYLTRIEEITFSGNPVCRNNDTYVKLLIYLPNINCVDGVKLETISTETTYYQ